MAKLHGLKVSGTTADLRTVSAQAPPPSRPKPRTRFRTARLIAGVFVLALVVGAIAAAKHPNASTQSKLSKQSAAVTTKVEALAYIRRVGNAASDLQSTVADVETADGIYEQTPSDSNLIGVTRIVELAHTQLNQDRDVIPYPGSGVLGTAEGKMFNAANELKDSMGAMLRVADSPTPTNIVSFQTQFHEGRSEWNEGVRAVWRFAGKKNPPTV